MNKDMGRYAFLGGIALAIILALIPTVDALSWIVVLLGVVVAAVNIEAKETMKLLLWTIGMGVFGLTALASNLAGIPAVGTVLSSIITNVGLFFAVIAGVFLLKIGYKIFEK